MDTDVIKAARLPYERLAGSEEDKRTLMAWYFRTIGNIPMAERMRKGDTIPTVELSRAQRYALNGAIKQDKGAVRAAYKAQLSRP